VLAQIADAHRSVERRGQLSIFGDVPRRDLGALAGLQFNGRLPDTQITRIARRTFSNSTSGMRDRLSARSIMKVIFLHHSPSVMPPLRRGSGYQKIFREKITHDATLCFY
jgi:hypothetical protein